MPMNDSQHGALTHHDTLVCIECGGAWLDASERWRLYLTDDEPREAVAYCEHCASREFG